MSIFGFGYDEHNDDYKVLYAYYSNKGDENVVLVYSFKYESWKRNDRESSSGFVNLIIVVFVSGFHLKREMEIWVMNVYAIEEYWIKPVCISNLPVHHPLTRGLDNTAYMAMCNAKLSIAHVYENGDNLMMTFGDVLRFPFGEGFQMITLYGLAGKQKIPLQEPKNSNPPSGIKTELLGHM
nr:F-box/kelch-repeat protein At3g23880-like [Ipomoea batatas]